MSNHMKRRYLISLCASILCLIILFILAYSQNIEWLKEYSFLKIYLISIIVHIVTHWVTGFFSIKKV